MSATVHYTAHEILRHAAQLRSLRYSLLECVLTLQREMGLEFYSSAYKASHEPSGQLQVAQLPRPMLLRLHAAPVKVTHLIKNGFCGAASAGGMLTTRWQDLHIDDLLVSAQAMRRLIVSIHTKHLRALIRKGKEDPWRTRGLAVQDFQGRVVGYTTGRTSACRLEGCTGIRVHIKPLDGSRVRMACAKCFEVKTFDAAPPVLKANHKYFNLINQ